MREYDVIFYYACSDGDAASHGHAVYGKFTGSGNTEDRAASLAGCGACTQGAPLHTYAYSTALSTVHTGRAPRECNYGGVSVGR